MPSPAQAGFFLPCLASFLACSAALMASCAEKNSPAPGRVLAAEIKPGWVRYGEASGEEHTAFVFAPSAADGKKDMPIIMLMDPSGDSAGIVRRYKPAAERHGWLLASLPAIRNGTPTESDQRELSVLLEYMRRSYSVDARLVFLGGFSGGGCGAYAIALMTPEVYRGAVVENGHMGPWRELRDTARGNLAFFLFARKGDFNHPATLGLFNEMKARGFAVAYKELEGSHAPMGPDELEDAFNWLERQGR